MSSSFSSPSAPWPMPGCDGEHLLQERYGTADRARGFYRRQVLDHLNTRMRAFLARQELVFIATADARGECDCSLRAGPPGFVRVLDEGSLAIPEYRGNGVMASLGNLQENPHIGMLFPDLVTAVIGLHVNGHARVVETGDLPAAQQPPDPPTTGGTGRGEPHAERWVLVTVQEAYIHCAKHLPRMVKAERHIEWGTDDVKRKGGDFFGAALESQQAPPQTSQPASQPASQPGSQPPSRPESRADPPRADPPASPLNGSAST